MEIKAEYIEYILEEKTRLLGGRRRDRERPGEPRANPRVADNGQKEPELRRRGEPERPESPK